MSVPRWVYLAMVFPLFMLITLPYYYPWTPFMTLKPYNSANQRPGGPQGRGAGEGGSGSRMEGQAPESPPPPNPGLIGMDVEEMAYSIPHGKPYAHSSAVSVGVGVKESSGQSGAPRVVPGAAMRSDAGPVAGRHENGDGESDRKIAKGGVDGGGGGAGEEANSGQGGGAGPTGASSPVTEAPTPADVGGRAGDAMESGSGGGGVTRAAESSKGSPRDGNSTLSGKDSEEERGGSDSEMPFDKDGAAGESSGGGGVTPAKNATGKTNMEKRKGKGSGGRSKDDGHSKKRADKAKKGRASKGEQGSLEGGKDAKRGLQPAANAPNSSEADHHESAPSTEPSSSSLRGAAAGADVGPTETGGDAQADGAVKQESPKATGRLQWDPVDVTCPKPSGHRLYKPFKIKMETDRDAKIRPLGSWAAGLPGITATAMVEGWPSLDENVLNMAEMVPQRQCTWETCFDRERPQCRGQTRFGVYEYPIAKITSFGSGRPCLEFGDIGDMGAAGFNMVDIPEEACLFLVRPPCGLVSSDLWALPHWDGGRNHIIIYPNVLDRNNPDMPVVTYDTGAAMLVHQGHVSGIFRPGFDIQIIVSNDLSIVHQYPSTIAPWALVSKETPSKYITAAERKDGNLAGRNITMSFRGNLYEWPILWCGDRWLGASTLNSPENGFVYEYGCVCTETHTARTHNNPLSASPENSKRFRELLVTSRYIFTPGGGGGYSYRFIEVLTSGAVPVVTDDLVLPLGEIIAWDRCAVAVPRARIPEIPQILAKISEEERLKRVDVCVNAAKMFQSMSVTFDGMWESIGSRLLKDWHLVTPEG